MTAYMLKEKHLNAYPNSHFFDMNTLKFFGETMSTMRVLKGTTIVTSCSGEEHECLVLSSLQRKHPNGPRRIYHFFDACTYEQVIV